MTPSRAVSVADISQLAELIRGGHDIANQRLTELKADLDAKHQENRTARHEQAGKIGNLQGENHLIRERLTKLESTVKTIVGDDNDGGSGLLHDIDRKVDAMQGEIASIKQTVQDAPDIKKWVYGAAAVIAFLVVVLPMVLTVVLWLLKH